jgi:glycosyltransferase involved in cell wall biosynthesis
MLLPAANQQLISVTDINPEPILSIAIPTYKRFELLKETLASVFSLEFSISVEILVVDNDPEQPELALAAMEEFRGEKFSYYKNQDNLGMFGNWNQCICLARGKYITLLHDDDILLPEFSMQMNNLLNGGKLDGEIVSFAVSRLDLRADRPIENSKTLNFLKRVSRSLAFKKFPEIKGVAELFFGNPFYGTLGVVMNRNLASSMSGFDKHWYPIADYEFWSRWTCQVGPIPFVQNRVGNYRIQENESLRIEVRQGFISGSTALRQRLIAQHYVPSWFTHLVGLVSWFQKNAVNLDWRTRDEPDSVFFRVVGLRLWREAVSGFCIFLRKIQGKRRFF